MIDIPTLLVTQPGALSPRDVVDGYKSLNTLRLAMQKEVDAIESVEKQYKEHLIRTLEKGNDKGFFGTLYKATHTTEKVVKISEEYGGWKAFQDWILQTGRFDVLPKSLNQKALKEMEEAGELPPGLDVMYASKLSVTKI